MDSISYIQWNDVTHVVFQNENIIVHYSNNIKEFLVVDLEKFNTLLSHNESFLKVNYNIIVNKRFIRAISRARRKLVILVDETEIVVSRRKSYYFK